MKVHTLHNLFVMELEDVLDAEKQLVKALPKMAKAASNKELAKGFEKHLKQTQEHVKRLERTFKSLNEKPRTKTCQAMKGLVAEGSEVIKMRNVPDEVRDAGLISSAQRVEHYEIAAYGCLMAYAKQMGHDAAVKELQMTLNEEKETDQKLTDIAESEVNPAANEMMEGEMPKAGSRRK